LRTITDVVCPVCGCLCDDLEVHIDDNDQIVKVKNACNSSIAKFTSVMKERILKPRVHGKEVSLDEAIDEAAKILANSKFPLLYGWSTTTVEATKKGILLAELLGGVIDNTSSVCHGPTVLGIQEAGVITGTLGDVKNRADLIIYWGSNPLESHQMHLTRYSYMSKGRFYKSKKERTMVVVDVRKTRTARLANKFIQIRPGEDFELAAALRMAIKGQVIEQEEVAGVPVSEIEKFADMLISARHGVIFFGMGVTMSEGKFANIEQLVRLVQDLNGFTKFIMIPMRGHYNVKGSGSVLDWITGYPFGVDFSREYPFYNPGDTTSVDILRRKECDSALVVASDPVAHFPISVIKYLKKIPLIAIDPHESATTKIADVVIPTAIAGIEAEGTAYRMDAVPLKLKKLIEPPEGILTDEEVLERIYERVKEIKGD